jgi:hypothetical protein
VPITTRDQLLASLLPPEPYVKVGATMEAAGVAHSMFYTAGRPGAAAVPSPGINGAALTSYAGQVPFPTAVGGENVHLAGLSANSNIAGALMLIDRLWHNSGLAVATTTAQAITPPALPARDLNGATLGAGVLAALEVSTATTNASAVTNTTMSYTDEAGNAGNVGTIPSFPATAVAGSFIPFSLAAGDHGVRSVQSVTLGTSYVAGAIHLVLYRVLAVVPVSSANVPTAFDALQVGFPRCYDQTVPQLIWLPSATAGVTAQGTVTWAQG